MAKKTVLKKEIKSKITKYINLLKTSGIKIEQVILFGSFAKGNPKPWSDIDLCVVSSEFGKDEFKESVFLAREANKIDPIIEPYPLNPIALKEKFIPLIHEIITYGIRIV
jgi:predicted nucleotidyltransferase